MTLGRGVTKIVRLVNFGSMVNLNPRNFVDNGRSLTQPAPIDRANTGLSAGAGLVKIQPMLTMFQGLKGNHIKNNGNIL